MTDMHGGKLTEECGQRAVITKRVTDGCGWKRRFATGHSFVTKKAARKNGNWAATDSQRATGWTRTAGVRPLDMNSLRKVAEYKGQIATNCDDPFIELRPAKQLAKALNADSHKFLFLILLYRLQVAVH